MYQNIHKMRKQLEFLFGHFMHIAQWLKIRSSSLGKGVLENIQQIYKRTPMPKCDFNKVTLQLYWNHISAWGNFIEITFQHGCSPVNLLHIFRRPFSKNTFGWLLLEVKTNCMLQRYRRLTMLHLAIIKKVLI